MKSSQECKNLLRGINGCCSLTGKAAGWSIQKREGRNTDYSWKLTLKEDNFPKEDGNPRGDKDKKYSGEGRLIIIRGMS